MSAEEPPAVDGRRRRSQRSREKIIEAVVRALSKPDIEITVERVAAEAGVSLSTLFRHFGDIEGVSDAATAHIRARLLPILLRGPFEGDTATRVHDLVDRRSEAAAISRPLRRTAQRWGRPTARARERDRETRAQLRAQVLDALAPELVGAPPERVAALDALLSFEAFDHLCVHQELPAAGAARAIEQAVLILVAAS